MTSRSDERAGTILSIVAALLWGTSWVATAYALQGFSPLAVAGWRGLGGLALIAVFARFHPAAMGGDRRRLDAGRLGRLIVLGCLGGAAFQIGVAYAVHLSGATLAAFVAGVYPVLAAAGAGVLLGERPSRLVYGGLVVSFAGVVLLAGFDPVGGSPAGLALGLMAAAAFAGYLLLARRWSTAWELPAPLIATAVLAMVALVALPLAFVTDPAGLVPAGGFLPVLAVLWLAGPVGAVAMSAAIAGVRRLPSHRSSALFLLNPLTAALLAAVLLGEGLGPLQVAGCALVLAGVALATVLGARGGRSREAPAASAGSSPDRGAPAAGRIL